MTTKPNLLIICGPTATGKTSLALKLAEKFNGDLISCDSRQVYKYMSVVTGKDIPPEFRLQTSEFRFPPLTINKYTNGLINIWGYDLVRPDQDFNVSLYLEFACRVLTDVWQRGKLPILVGGTGMYIKSLLNPPQTLGVPVNKKLRASLNEKSADELYALLLKTAPMKAAQMLGSERLNPPRLIRALEVINYQGADPLAISPELAGFINLIPTLNTLQLGLNFADRQLLYHQIDARVEDRILNDYLIDELDFLGAKNYLAYIPSRTIGYQQLLNWMAGDTSLTDAIQSWKFAEHAYARRQLTWFRKISGIHWFNLDESGWKEQMGAEVEKWFK